MRSRSRRRRRRRRTRVGPTTGTVLRRTRRLWCACGRAISPRSTRTPHRPQRRPPAVPTATLPVPAPPHPSRRDREPSAAPPRQTRRPDAPAARLGRWTMNRRILTCSVLTLALCVLGPSAFACGGLLSPNGSVNLVKTTTLAAYHAGVEHYVTSF